MALNQRTSNEIEKRANAVVLAACGSMDQGIFPIDLDKVLETYAITYQAGNFQDDTVAGAYNRKARTILVSSEETYPKRVFTVAHELGHHFLHKGKKEEEVYFKKNLENINGEDEGIDQEANWFAASLLMPREAVEKAWAALRNLDDMVKLFGVSKSAMRFRLKKLNLMR